MKCNTQLVASMLAICAAAHVQNAVAASVGRNQYYQPTFACQGALPSYEGQLRKRPLAIANESASMAFVSCGLPMEMSGEVGLQAGATYVYVVLTNRGSQQATVNCTLVEGYGGFGAAYHPKGVTLASGATVDTFAWGPQDNNSTNYFWPSLSCVLPPGVEINGVTQQFRETVTPN